jgi:actin-related protein
LQADLDATKIKVEAKLQDCKRRYKLQLAEISKQKELDIEDLRKRYSDLQWQKDLQER